MRFASSSAGAKRGGGGAHALPPPPPPSLPPVPYWPTHGWQCTRYICTCSHFHEAECLPLLSFNRASCLYLPWLPVLLHISIQFSTLAYKGAEYDPNGRDVIGSDVVIGDMRWAGAWGLRADFIAKTTCSILYVSLKDVMVIDSLTHPLTHITKRKKGGGVGQHSRESKSFLPLLLSSNLSLTSFYFRSLSRSSFINGSISPSSGAWRRDPTVTVQTAQMWRRTGRPPSPWI
jgi:hypothetical protein